MYRYILILLLFPLSFALSQDANDVDVRIIELSKDIRERMRASFNAQEFRKLPAQSIEKMLNDEEKRRLANEYLQFEVSQDGTLYIFHDNRLLDEREPFWLFEPSFERTELTLEAYQKTFTAYKQDVSAGRISLGVHALRTYREHYIVVFVADDDTSTTQIVPVEGYDVRATPFILGAQPWLDRSVKLDNIPETLNNATLIQLQSQRRKLVSLYDYFNVTEYPAKSSPDQVFLTVTESPSTEMYIQWRTSLSSPNTELRIKEVNSEAYRYFKANSKQIDSLYTVNDKSVFRHSVKVTDLKPNTQYQYQIRVSQGNWEYENSFTTAPESGAFTFWYFGDVQEGFDDFEDLLLSSQATLPKPAFAIFAGDLVSMGNHSDDWDAFLNVWQKYGGSIPMAPAVGNHEILPNKRFDLYADVMRLPENGPQQQQAERAYWFKWADSLFVSLDSNSDDGQTQWLENTLLEKREHVSQIFSIAHHGAFTSRPGRYYSLVSEKWRPLWEHFGVELVMQGHDHAYLRSIPQALDNDKGTVYVIATAGSKFYPQAKHAYAAHSFTDIATIQIITVDPNDDTFKYRAISKNGIVVDAFTH
uniref:purple acid phosphatase family protein n=1 Tax=Ningiella ruwaisensis TaxID=2364274 RepID=UPI0010A001CD|nr:metallophosphoesterase family protein [Ningiella ruwaisensis]